MMRNTPVGYMFDKEQEVIKNAHLATIPTHNSSEALFYVTNIALMIYYFRVGYSKEDVIKKLNLKVEYIPFTKFNCTCKETFGNVLYAIFLNIEKTINKIKDNNKTTNKDEYEKQILKLNNDIDKIKRLKKVAYEDWKLERISKEEFINYSNDYEKSIENLNNEIKVYENKIEASLRDIKEDEYWIEHFRRNKKIKSLSREVIEELIDCIYIHEGGNITIKFKYQDEYERALKSIENEKEVAV